MQQQHACWVGALLRAHACGQQPLTLLLLPPASPPSSAWLYVYVQVLASCLDADHTARPDACTAAGLLAHDLLARRQQHAATA